MKLLMLVNTRKTFDKGEPGTGKTKLAENSQTFFTQLISWHIKSTTKAQQGLYEYDTVSDLGFAIRQ